MVLVVVVVGFLRLFNIFLVLDVLLVGSLICFGIAVTWIGAGLCPIFWLILG